MKKALIKFILLCVIAVPAIADQSHYDMINAKWIMDNKVLVGGQPTLGDIARMKEAGVSAIINLRGKGEFDQSESIARAKKMGIIYKQLPISGRTDVSLASAKSLDAILASFKDKKVTLHCASSNRVGALLALRAFHLQGKTKDQAMKIGIGAGMKSLKYTVEALLIK